MPEALVQHRQLVLSAYAAGDVFLTDFDNQEIQEPLPALLYPSRPRPVRAYIWDVLSEQWVGFDLSDAKDLDATEYVRYFAAAASQAGPASPYWKGLLI